ncbi:MAG: sigma-54 dependent transcriptional regulator [Candidatus Aminicenantes bacterium]|nr:sigma-54 dependent transcriptional regulator [Candidatus Aminicenantes bacterium]
MENRENLLVAGPDASLFDQLAATPVAEMFQLSFCPSREDLSAFIRENSIRFVLLEVRDASDQDAAKLAEIKNSDPLLNVLISGPPIHPEEALEWIRRGASDYLEKPVSAETARAALRKALDKRELRRETFLLERKLEKKYVFQGMVSKSPYMLEVFGLIESVARHFASVLVTGETGTGKELVARALHALSETKNRRLVICDCASIPETLFESELFGYVKGAFTGADRTKRGLFEEAHEGVIFLDEIGEIPLPVQAKMLRVLENRQFRPLGSNDVRYVNVRVIAATNRDLPELIRRSAFREDLYHRLNRVEVHLPPLRERPEDMPLLVRHFLDGTNKAFGKSVKGLSRDVQKLFLKYDWPGNVRELENVLQSATMTTHRDFIDVSDLPKALREQAAARPRPAFGDRDNLSTLDDLEKEYIAYLLKLTAFNLKRTAKVLNISRTTLYNKMAKYGLVREPRPPSKRKPTAPRPGV